MDHGSEAIRCLRQTLPARSGACGKPGKFAVALPELVHVARRRDVHVVRIHVFDA
jgi:hypothetical protein